MTFFIINFLDYHIDHLRAMEVHMKVIKHVLISLALISAGFSSLTPAEEKDPLFISLSSDAAKRVEHVLHFSELQFSRGHPLTIWLNETGIFLASREYTKKHADRQKALAELINKGASVIVCQYCMKQLEVEDSDLLPGFKVGNPDLVGGALFKENTRTLSW